MTGNKPHILQWHRNRLLRGAIPAPRLAVEFASCLEHTPAMVVAQNSEKNLGLSGRTLISMAVVFKSESGHVVKHAEQHDDNRSNNRKDLKS